MDLKKFYTGKAIGFVIVILVAGAFYGGMIYGKNKTPALGIDRFGSDMQNKIGQFGANMGNGRMGGGIVAGEIISADDKSITVKMMGGGPNSTTNTGGSKIIFLDTNTTISKMITGAKTDLATGLQISVTGATNSDGSMIAKTIQIRDKTSEVK